MRGARPRRLDPLVSHAQHAAPAALAGGVVLVAAEHVEALDVVSGRTLGHARLIAPTRLLADEHLNAWGMDAEGVVTAVKLETHLSVV